MTAVIGHAGKVNYFIVLDSGKLGKSPRSAVNDVARILDLAHRQQPAAELVTYSHGGTNNRTNA